jgi:hypothetical protein
MRTVHTPGVLAVVVAVLAGLLSAAPAAAQPRVTPGDFTGYAFDTCEAPDSATMDAWRRESPFWGVGVYIGGANRLCPNADLDRAWVQRQSRRGWRILPIWVGPQAACAAYPSVIDDRPARDYLAAARQGRHNAERAVRAARALGIPAHSTLWYDLEDYPLDDTDCRRSALAFLSAWTNRLHRLGYTSGVYSSAAAAIHSLDYADQASRGSYAMPDQVWFAWENGRADVRVRPRWVRRSSWMPGGRVHQYRLDEEAEFGGERLVVDWNYLQVGRGSHAPRPRRNCGVRVDFGDYRALRPGARHAQVAAAQCLLKQRGLHPTRVDGHFDRATARSVRAFQRRVDLRPSGRLNAATWTSLLAQGATPLVKIGSASRAVLRLQRSLTAALDRTVATSGVFRAGTTRAVRQYQRARGLDPTGVATKAVWRELRSGRR